MSNKNLTKYKKTEIVDFDESKLFTISEVLKIYHPDKINLKNSKDPKVINLFHAKNQRREITNLDYDWRKANWMDPNDHDVGDNE